jgi:hypothetical protein
MQYIILNRGKKLFFTMWGIWVSKDAELNLDFKNTNLYKRQNAPKKSKSRIKILFTTQGALYIVHDPKYHDLRARGQWTKKYFFAFSILLDGLAHISAIFLLKMQKKSKIGSPY